MYKITNDKLRAIKAQDFALLKEKAKGGDCMAQWVISMCIMFAQIEESESELFKYLSLAMTDKDEMPFMMIGYTYEHAIGTSKNYSKAVEFYSKAYDILNKIHTSGKDDVKDGEKTLQEMERIFEKLINQIAQIVTIKNFCQFKNDQFFFPWSDETRDSLNKLLPQLINDVATFEKIYTLVTTNLKDEEKGKWEFQYQDKILMPIEIMKTLVVRDYLENYLMRNGFQLFPSDRYFNNAIGRCLIDDDDAYDNDYIIGGLLLMAGHDNNPLWQYRVGLWYEYCDNNLEPQTASFWYEQIKSEIPSAKSALERVKGSLQYRILKDSKVGSAKDCQTLSIRSSKNPQNSINWLIESALRGDEIAIQRLERNQFSPKGASSIFKEEINFSIHPFYTLLKEEASADIKANKNWRDKNIMDREAYRKAEEERIREAEKCKALLSKINNAKDELEKLTTRWEDVLSKFMRLSKNLENAERELEEDLTSVRRKWWQFPFYSEGIMTVEDCLQEKHNEGEEKIDKFKNIKGNFEVLSNKVEKEWKDIKEIENNSAKLESKLNSIQNQLKKIQETIKKGSSMIYSIESHINSMRDGSSLDYVYPEFNIQRTCYSIVFVWAVLSFIIVSFIPSNFWTWSLLLSFGGCGTALAHYFDLNKKGYVYAFIGGVCVAFVVFSFIPSEKKNNQESALTETAIDESDDQQSIDNDEEIETSERHYDYIYSADDNGWRQVELNKKKGFIDSNGKEIVKPIYDYIYSADDNGWRKVELNSKKGFIDSNGKEIVSPIYDYIYSWSGGLAKVEKDGKIGYINRKGKIVQPME